MGAEITYGVSGSKHVNPIEWAEHAILNGVAVKKVTPINSLIQAEYDYVSVAYPTTSSEVYTFKSGGSSGTAVGTITITYTDSTKENLSTVEKT